MYYVTAQHGAVFPHEIERLWSTVAGNKRNIIPILDYVVSKGQVECGQVGPVCCHYTAAWLVMMEPVKVRHRNLLAGHVVEPTSEDCQIIIQFFNPRSSMYSIASCLLYIPCILFG